MKMKFGIMVVASVLLFMSGCGSSPENQIIGKWEAGEQGLKITAEFAKDGKAKITMFGQTLEGTYKLNGDDLEWTVNGKTTKSKVKLTTTEMEMTGEGRTVKYKKV
jgi:uncharacterized protein (TIGR03066 family)